MPVVDGLRFLAILMVVLFHADAYLAVKSRELVFSQNSEWLTPLQSPFTYMGQGVKLFFVISGFILAVPFMRYYFGLSDRKPVLKAYFMRRLTRIEPPYIISTVVIFLIIVFITGSKYSLSTLVVSLGSSLLYIHTLVFVGKTPYINDVTWSLEIEVQYYILAPFIMWGICAVKDKHIRRAFTLALIGVFAFVGWLTNVYWQIDAHFITSLLQYFFSGILLCDVFLLDRERLEKLDRPWIFVLGLILLVPIAGIDHATSPYLALRMLSPVMILAFYLIVFGNRWWRSIFSLNGLTLIGGMCYSIYLLHYVAIPAVGRLTIPGLPISNVFVYYFIQTFIFIFVILVVSSVYFLLIEKPCMRQDWHIKVYEKIKNFALPGDKIELKNTI